MYSTSPIRLQQKLPNVVGGAPGVLTSTSAPNQATGMFTTKEYGKMYTVGGANQATWNVGGIVLNAEKKNEVFDQSQNLVRPFSESCIFCISY